MSKIIENGGEGNRAADRRYRDGVRETVDETSAEERSEAARNVSETQLKKAKAAAATAKSRARS